MKHLTIQRRNIKSGDWLCVIPAAALHTEGTAGGYRYVTTKRNYFLSHKDGKIHYQTMNCDNASYDLMLNVYIETYPGVFSFAFTCTEDDYLEKLCRAVELRKAMTPEFISDWFAQLPKEAFK